MLCQYRSPNMLILGQNSPKTPKNPKCHNEAKEKEKVKPRRAEQHFGTIHTRTHTLIVDFSRENNWYRRFWIAHVLLQGLYYYISAAKCGGVVRFLVKKTNFWLRHRQGLILRRGCRGALSDHFDVWDGSSIHYKILNVFCIFLLLADENTWLGLIFGQNVGWILYFPANISKWSNSKSD